MTVQCVNNSPSVALLLPDAAANPLLQRLAQQLRVPIISQLTDAGDVHLRVHKGKLQLVQGVGKTRRIAQLNFNQSRHRAAGPDPLLKAMGGAGRSVLDLTAGWGQDALHLARDGFKVCAIERHSSLVLMLQTAHQQIEDCVLHQRLQFVCADAAKDVPILLAEKQLLFSPFDVIYLDPMFPPKQRQSAAVKQPVVLLQALSGAYSDAEDLRLLKQARSLKAQRVVVKRPLKAAPIGCFAPSGTIKGKLVRFDIYTANLDNEA